MFYIFFYWVSLEAGSYKFRKKKDIFHIKDNLIINILDLV